MKRYESWGRYPSARHEILFIDKPGAACPIPAEPSSVLPFGLGRSYGDSCLNDGNCLIDTARLDNFIAFNRATGVLRAEAGVSLSSILEVFVPRGWFLPVSPGTKFVTLGGAVANDIHGKNHHCAGTFGRHVKAFELLRSTGERLLCTPTENAELFSATIGGLGLTGLITWVEIELHPISGPFLDTRTVQFRNLQEFFDVSAEHDAQYEFNVSWVDCTSTGPNLARGLFMAGNFSKKQRATGRRPSVTFPLDAPAFLLNPLTMQAFNTLYYNKQRRRIVDALTHYEPFFYPLDAILEWNRMYGKRGFFQYQLVVPFEGDRAVMLEIFRVIARSKRGSFLAVLKMFGDLPSPGMLSFPRKGVTLALDFPNEGRPTFELLDELDKIVMAAGGAIYPAKDARMSPATFEASFPRFREFEKHIDPRFSSSFWRRVRKI